MDKRRHFPALILGNLIALFCIVAGLSWGFSALFAGLLRNTDWLRLWEFRGTLAGGWLTSVGISLAALLGSLVFGLLFFLGQRSRFVVIRVTTRLFLESVRDTPLLVHLLFGYFVIFGPLLSRHLMDLGVNDKIAAGVAILSLFSGAYLGEILRGGVESIPATQWESARAVGFSTAQIYRHVIFPQALRRVLPAIAGLFVSLIKDSSLLSVIGATEFFYNTKNFINQTYAGLDGYLPLALGYLVLTVPLAWLSHALERKFGNET